VEEGDIALPVSSLNRAACALSDRTHAIDGDQDQRNRDMRNTTTRASAHDRTKGDWLADMAGPSKLGSCTPGAEHPRSDDVQQQRAATTATSTDPQHPL
jgi:hypothetical protein